MFENPHQLGSSPLVFHGATDVDRALHDYLGLSESVFRRAVLEGAAERNFTTSDDAPSAAGFYQWTRTLRELRVESRPFGWHRDSFLQIPCTMDADDTIAVAVSAGSADTGRADGNPTTLREKGLATERAIGQKRLSFSDTSPEDEVGIEFWYLLYSTEGEEIRAEVSRPAVMSETSGKVEDWDVRILLPSFDFDPGEKIQTTPTQPTPIHVPVARKPRAA